MNLADLKHFTDRRWDEDLVPRLVEYVKVPAKSPGFDASWAAHGHLQAVVKEAHAWAAAQKIKGLNLEIVALEGKTPCIFFDVPATGTFGNAKTVLFYGHLDKQPEMVGWREGLGPWKPVVEDGKLYGRGSADDGYAIYAALTIVAALDAQGTPRPRCVGIIETCEESGSPDLPAYLDLLAPRFGDVALVAGLDSGCGNYEQLWVTTSLRGLVGGTFTPTFPPSVCSRRRRRARSSATRCGKSFLGSAATTGPPLKMRLTRTRCPRLPIRSKASSRARGARRCRSPVRRASRAWTRRATCCGPRPPSSCRCACRPPSTASVPPRP